MNLRDLVYVVAVAEHESFTRAAQAVNVSQPALSNQIKKLEAELGNPIFERNQNGIALSRFGAEILNHARDIVEIASSIQDIAKSHRSLKNQIFKLGLTPTLAAYLSGYFRKTIMERYPDLKLFIVEDYPVALAKMVEDRTIDAALVARNSYDTIYDSAAPALDFTSLWLEPLYLAVRQSHPLAAKDAIWAHEVPQDQLIRFGISFGYDLEQNLPKQSQTAIENTGIDPSTSRFETVCRHVAQCHACTIVNAIAAEQFKEDGFGLAFVPFVDEGNMRELGVVTRPQFPHPKFLLALRDGIHEAPPNGTVASKSQAVLSEPILTTTQA